MTIYEVIESFFEVIFPESIHIQYQEILELMYFALTLILIFTFILIPLWKIATFFLRIGKK